MASQLSPAILTHWTKSDDQLVLLKLADAIKELHEQTKAGQCRLISDRARQRKDRGPQFYKDLWDSSVIELRKYLIRMDSVYRELQSKKGAAIDQRFLSEILRRNVLQTIQVRLSAIEWELHLMAKRTRASSHDVASAFRSIAFASNHLIAEFHRKYEIEIRELSLQPPSPSQSTSGALPAAPSVSTGLTEKREAEGEETASTIKLSAAFIAEPEKPAGIPAEAVDADYSPGLRHPARRPASRLPSPLSARKKADSFITSQIAVKRMNTYIANHNLRVEDFAERAKTSAKTIYNFRKNSRVRHTTLRDIAVAMDITPEALTAP